MTPLIHLPATLAVNNLFHGGTYTAEAAPGRDVPRVRSARTLLRAVIEAQAVLRDTSNHV